MPIDADSPARKARWPHAPGWLALAVCCAALMACQQAAPLHPAAAAAAAAAVDDDVAVEAPAPASAAAAAPATERAPLPDTVPVETAEASLMGLLRYAERLRGMSAAERRQELTTQGGLVPRSSAWPTPASGPSPKTQMQLAFVLLQTHEPVETARALGLLQRVATSAEPEAIPYAALARLLSDNLITTRRLEDNLERTTQQLRESQRRIDALSERLDAMRAIERSMNPQPPTSPRPVRP